MSKPMPQVLIPIDLSEQSLITLDQSHNLARFYRAELTILYVIDSGKKLDVNIDEEAHKKDIIYKLYELAAAVSKKHNIKVNPLLAKGQVYQKILDVAEMVRAKLIIMGANGAISLNKRGVDSHTLRVVEGAKCPVVTIKGKQLRSSYKNIVLPLDLTKETTEKVKYAIDLGKTYGASIRVVSVLSEQNRSEVKRLEMQMKQAAFLIRSEVTCTTDLIKIIQGHEKPAQTVVDYVKKVDADLLMIMTQQEQASKIIPITNTSDTHDILNNSDISVMSIVPSVRQEQSRTLPFRW